MNEKIVSKANARVKELCALRDHPSPTSFLIEGKHMVDMAYEHRVLDEVIACIPVSYPGIKTLSVSEEVLAKIASSKTPSGILGVAHAPKSEAVGDALILDRVQDPGNVGTLLRSALSFGFKDIYFLPGTASPFSSKALASSQGAIFAVKIHMATDFKAVLFELSKQGCRVLGTSLRGALPISTYKRPDSKIALVLGNEGRGVSEEILSSCDEKLFIEMEEMESLNVGVAGGIAMYLLRK